MDRVYHHACFNKSAAEIRQAPLDEGIEIAFAGRSNAGKSSAINALTRQKSLARISKTPGRTQLINFFDVSDRCRFVDLPGYGYAKVPTEMKKNWYRLIEDYFSTRVSLKGIVLVMDVRHPLTEFDWQMVEWCEFNGKPMHILLTKADKLKFGATKNIQLAVQKDLKDVTIPISVQLFSALKKTGIDEIHGVLHDWFGFAEEEMKKPSK